MNEIANGAHQDGQQPLESAPLFICSIYCPECMAPNLDRAERCGLCGAITRWETEADYDARKNEIRHTARRAVLTGLAEVCIAIVILMVLGNVAALSLAVVLLVDGVRRITKGSRYEKFE